MNQNDSKNIIYIENGIGYGGAIICLRHLVRNLDRNRYRPLVVTGRTGPHYREIAQEADWRYLPDRRIDVVGMRRRLDQAAWVKQILGLHWLLNQLLARMDDLGNFLPFFLQLLWTAWRFKADLVHANNEPLCNRAALLVGKTLNIPTVCHVRGDLDGSRLMSWSYSLPDHFISVSEWVSRNMQNTLQVPAADISVIYDGIELEKLDLDADGQAFRQQYSLNSETFAVGLVGLLIPWKGQELFLDAAKLLRDKIPNLKMLIIGGTPDDCVGYEKMLRQRVADENLENIVVFTGHASKMEPVYNGLDVVVSASTSPEPLGTVVIESLALARPLIGPDHGGAAEMIEHERTGLLFKHGDAGSLADAILTFYEKPELRQTLGANARAHALKTFAVENHVSQVQAVYERLFREC
ncbi:glycosyltransferase family 4 protein [Methylomarinum vadi]|uniref:glycosyltransferase family 4 protein n=1 Tax=Methylomarinum vadi TaxID=438855 RepID=UPI0004DEE561|nr:glycosyltransferase family 4 protein [Methylomarinum vadi]